MPKHITKDKKEQIVSFYKSKPMTINYVSEQFNISCPSVMKILNEYNIKRYSKVKLFSPELDEHYFNTIDTEEKAYFLGLIITDGCVHNTKGRQPLLSITLKANDEYLLKTFKKEIHSNKNITSDGRGCSEIQILSQIMINDLQKYGVIPNKSCATVFPKNIPQEMYPHLIRGILDGDGSISYYARPNRKCHVKAIRFCQGSEKFLQDLVDYLYTAIGLQKINTYKEKESLWSIAYRKDVSMIKLIDYIYGHATIYMKRKKKLCDLVYAEAYRYGSTEITNGIKKPLAS